ncbi:unnamed protein product, partial [Symbiodinium microadriaticum]
MADNGAAVSESTATAEDGAAVPESTATAEDGAATALTGEAMAALTGEVGEAMAMLDGAAMALAGQAAVAMAGEGTDGLDGAAGRTVAHHGEAAPPAPGSAPTAAPVAGAAIPPAPGSATTAAPVAGIDWRAFVDRNNQFIDWAVTKFKRIEESQTRLLGQFQPAVMVSHAAPPAYTASDSDENEEDEIESGWLQVESASGEVVAKEGANVYKCVTAIAMTDVADFANCNMLRRIDVGEALELMGDEVHEGEGSKRQRFRACKDGAE